MNLLDDDFLPNTDNLYSLKCKIYHGSLLCNLCSLMWFDYFTDGYNPLVFSTRTKFLCTHMDVFSIIHFLFNRFIFFTTKKNKILTTISFFTLSRFFRDSRRLEWFDGNDCCPMSTARLHRFLKAWLICITHFSYMTVL